MLEPRKRGRRSKRPNIAQLDMMVQAGFTNKQIADEFGVCEGTVKHWFATYRKELREAKHGNESK